MRNDSLYMLWSDTKPVGEAVQRALEYYTKKYGVPPTIVQFSKFDDTIPSGDFEVQRIDLPKGHFLVGELSPHESQWLNES